MALIQCPECKKEISDQSEICIHCGYPIAAMLKKQKELEQKKKLAEERAARQKAIDERVKEIQDAELEEAKSKVIIPKKEPKITGGIVGGIMLILAGFGILFFYALTNDEKIITGLFFMILLIIAGMVNLDAGLKELDKRKEIYNKYHDNLEEHKTALAKHEMELEREREFANDMLIELFKPKSISVTCPYCKSNNVAKIGTIGRAVSVHTKGAASGKIGKQWHCNNCKSNF